jgi:hypothetical protein
LGNLPDDGPLLPDRRLEYSWRTPCLRANEADICGGPAIARVLPPKESPMTRWFRSSTALLLLAASSAALASFHTFKIEQLYSNADGSVQFIVMRESAGAIGENFWAGLSLISTHAGVNKTVVVPANLPSALTAGRSVLIATQGFSALGVVTPDYVIPSGFLPTDGGTFNYAGVDSVTFSSLPTDGANAINRNGIMIPNVATNYAGESGSAVPAPTAFTPVGGVWWNPNEDGSGYALDYQNGTLLVQIYSYQSGGPAQWYLAAGPMNGNVFTKTLDKYVGGQCISCAYMGRPTNAGNDGTITLTFTSPTSATAALPGGRQIQIQRYFQP